MHSGTSSTTAAAAASTTTRSNSRSRRVPQAPPKSVAVAVENKPASVNSGQLDEISRFIRVAGAVSRTTISRHFNISQKRTDVILDALCEKRVLRKDGDLAYTILPLHLERTDADMQAIAVAAAAAAAEDELDKRNTGFFFS